MGSLRNTINLSNSDAFVLRTQAGQYYSELVPTSLTYDAGCSRGGFKWQEVVSRGI